MTWRVWLYAGITFALMTWSGSCHYSTFAMVRDGARLGPSQWETWAGALLFSVPLLAILVVHEAAHVLACRRYGVAFTGPYLLPGFLAVTGTFGAFLRIKSPYPSRVALFDIAASGPFAGTVLSLACFLLGLGWSVSTSIGGSNVRRLGEPLIAAWAAGWMFPDAAFVVLHPIAVAGWIGLVLQMMNLTPYGAFDGGHIAAAVLGPTMAWGISVVMLIVAAVLAWSWQSWFGILLGMIYLGWHAERPLDGGAVPRSRQLAAIGMVAIWLLCLTRVL